MLSANEEKSKVLLHNFQGKIRTYHRFLCCITQLMKWTISWKCTLILISNQLLIEYYLYS